MQFSYCLIPTGTVTDAVEAIARAERWGCDLVWVPDEGFMRDPYVVLASAATRTREIGLGLGIGNPFTRHPVQLARAMATLSDLRNGQVIFGLGAGLKSIRHALGIADADFVQTARDCILVIQRLLRGERVSFRGPVFQLNDSHLDFLPSVPVPIYVASTHRAAFELAGERADGIIVGNVAEPEAFASVVSWTRDSAHRARRDTQRLKVVAWNIVVCTEEADRAYEMMRPMIARSIAIAHRDIRALLGIDQDRWKRIHAAVRTTSEPVTAELLPNGLVDKLAIVGPLTVCLQRIAALEQAGATMLGARATLELMQAFNWEDNVRQLSEGMQAMVPA
jgi:5,10-methylenetetrahydromethanopterin reductase